MLALTPWLVLFHILAALWLAGGAFAGAVVRAQTRKAPDLASRVQGMRIGNRLMQVFALPGGITVGILGIALVVPRGIGFQQGWVHASIGLWLLMLGNGVLYLRPWMQKALAEAEASLATGGPTDELKRLTAMKGPRIAADLNALGIVVLTALMVLKPF
ncbi:MAG: DUF2269 family protein [Acidobacteria bacterium]|nr:DUF2269 family protein [Acidobacteriota bacterium]MCB9378353.1 DUF2269 family protein [Holophagales bacterium]